MTQGKVDQIISAMQRTSRNGGELLINSDGTLNAGAVGNWQQDVGLGGSCDSVFIVFQGGRRLIPAEEARALLKNMMGQAHASETKYRKTGKGNTNLDVIMQNQMKVPDR